MKRITALIIAIFCFSIVIAQQVTVTGTVTVQDGEAIIGCSILKSGSSIGTITDIDGKYSITINVGDILKFAYLGYKSEEVKIVSGKTVYDVVLEEEIAYLSESIVVGYAAGVYSTRRESIISLPRSPYDALTEEEYTEFGENKFKPVRSEPVSTFSADVDKASYSNVRRFLGKDVLPPRDAVRTEELINYFPYDYKQPTMDNPIVMEAEVGKCPWNNENILCKIGLKTRDIPKKDLPASNFVFLIDVSGSMEGPTRLDLVKSSMSLLTDNLSKKDKVAIVVYAGSAGLVLPSTSGKNKEEIKSALDRLQAGGSTAGGAGIQLAYKIARENFIKDGNNRVIICSDGDFNVGPSSNKDLEELIEEESKFGVFLSVLGYGMGNYKDSKMQTLAQKGNGNHAYINDMAEANRVLVTEFAGTLYTVAKDVKLQVEFNQDRVEAYRLIGYETRLLAKEDFDNDLKDAGDMGSGHTVTALYELIPAKGNVKGDLLTVNMRYKDPQEDTSKLLSITVPEYNVNTKNSTDFNFASAVAMFAQLLRNSEFKGSSTYDEVERLAKTSLGKDKNGYRKEFADLVKKTQSITLAAALSGKPVRYGIVHMGDDFETFYEEVGNEEKEGMKDSKGKIIVPAKYDDVEYVKGGIFIVELNDKQGLFNYYSGEMTQLIYDDIEELGDDLFLVEANDLHGVLDLYGKEIIRAEYDDIEYNYNNYIKVEKDDKYGLFNYEGKKLIPVKYDDIDVSGDKTIIVEKNNLRGMYNSEGKMIISAFYEDIRPGYNYILLETPNGKYGIANQDGKILISANLDESPDRMRDDKLLVIRKEKEGVVNMLGKTIIPLKYNDIDDLTQDIFVVNKEGGKYGAYNSKGKKIAQETYDDIELLDETEYLKDENGLYGYIIVEKNDKYGLISASGKVILQTVYDDIESEEEEGQLVIKAEKGDNEITYNLKGEKIREDN